jgi:hypothetical protein
MYSLESQGAIVCDPEIPGPVRRELERAPHWRLIAYGAPAPAVISPPSAADRREYVPTTAAMWVRWSAIATGALVAGIIIVVSASGWNDTATLFSWCFVSAAAFLVSLGKAATGGWRKPSPRTDPGSPRWIGLHAVTAYHRRYIVPAADLDEEALRTWQRASSAAGRIRQSEVVGLGLLDSPQILAALPHHLWDVAKVLADTSGLRRRHRSILQRMNGQGPHAGTAAGPDDPEVKVVLDPQREAIAIAIADAERRVRQLEEVAHVIGRADAARQRQQGISELASLNDEHRDMLSRLGGSGNDLTADGKIASDSTAITDQANEAIRQANEAGRSLVIPRTWPS